jgi:DNA-binding NarL/FixJ family response regulator
MDVSMPRLNGMEATRRIKTELPGAQVIGLSLYDDRDLAASMREAGALAYLNKAGPFESLIQAIRACVRTSS